jgi:hypothetical protein
LFPVRRTIGPADPVSAVNVKSDEPVRRFDAFPKPIWVAVSAAPVPVESMEMVALLPDPVTVKSAPLNSRVLVGLTMVAVPDSVVANGGETGPDIHITISVVVCLPNLQHAIAGIRIEV